MKIALLSYYQYPSDRAEVIRQHMLAKLLTACGHTVLVVARGKSTGQAVNEYDGIDYISMRSGSGRADAIKTLLGYRYYLKRILKNHGPFQAVMSQNITPGALQWVKRSARKNHSLLLYDAVEWYSPEEFSMGRLSLEYLLKELWMRKLISGEFRVTAISRFLTDHFTSRGNRVLRLPVILDTQSAFAEKRVCPDKLTLLYAGSPGRKDRIKEVVEGCALLESELLPKLELRLFGLTKEQLSLEYGVNPQSIVKLGDSLKAFGRVPRDEVLENLAQVDFTVLLRPSYLRYAKAGFPTKVAESMTAATPVICNITSDLELCVTEGETGLIVSDCSAEAFSDAVRRALLLTEEQKQHMRRTARLRAEALFDFRNYINAMSALLDIPAGQKEQP